MNYDKSNPPIVPFIEILTVNELLKVSISDAIALKNPRWKICDAVKWPEKLLCRGTTTQIPNYSYIHGGRIIAMFDDNTNMLIYTYG